MVREKTRRNSVVGETAVAMLTGTDSTSVGAGAAGAIGGTAQFPDAKQSAFARSKSRHALESRRRRRRKDTALEHLIPRPP
jgi:hypothetical protein